MTTVETKKDLVYPDDIDKRVNYFSGYVDSNIQFLLGMKKEEYDALFGVGGGEGIGIPKELCEYDCHLYKIRCYPYGCKMQQDILQKFKAIIAIYDLKIPKENSKELDLLIKKVEKSIRMLQNSVYFVSREDNMIELELINKLVEELTDGMVERWKNYKNKVNQ